MSAHLGGLHVLARRFALVLIALVSVAVAGSALLLIGVSLLGGGTPAPARLGDSALIWAMNVVTFAVWYWEIDGGGPARRRRDRHASEDFLFPQIARGGDEARGWSPGFVDYLFLAFNTSTAFSPTDTAVLSRRAKVLTMAQSLIFLAVVAVLIGRAVDTLASAGGAGGEAYPPTPIEPHAVPRKRQAHRFGRDLGQRPPPFRSGVGALTTCSSRTGSGGPSASGPGRTPGSPRSKAPRPRRGRRWLSRRGPRRPSPRGCAGSGRPGRRRSRR